METDQEVLNAAFFEIKLSFLIERERNWLLLHLMRCFQTLLSKCDFNAMLSRYSL